MGAHGISAANASTMRSPVIVAVIALACAAIAQESSETVVPEMEMQQATGSGVGSKTVVQDHYEVGEVPQKQVIEKPVYENVTVPVETVHYVPVTKTVPVEKKVEVKEVVETKQTGCDLVVESCFASPSTEEVPAWKAPVIKYEHSYSNLCAPEVAAKKKAEKKEKAAEKEEKLFKSERDSKESAAKAVSMMSTHEKIVYVPSAAPAISAASPPKAVTCEDDPNQVQCLPKPSPPPAPVVPPKKYVCDTKKCQCVETTNAQGDDFNYCTEMCQTGPGCAPVPPPPVVTPAPPMPKILVGEQPTYYQPMPTVPTYPVPEPLPAISQS